MPQPDHPPFCNRCLEEFPLAPEPKLRGWAMGWLYPLTKAPAKIKSRYHREDENNYLCGNCYFDLTDEG